MILDENNKILYFDKRNKKVKLSNTENKILLFLIENKNKKNKAEVIMKKIYFNSSCIDLYKDSFNSTLYRLNLKLFPYAKIVAKAKFGYYLKEEQEYFNEWKESFFRNHKQEKKLLKLYKDKEILEKNIKALEKYLT